MLSEQPPCQCCDLDPKNFVMHIVDEFVTTDPETCEQVLLRIERQIYPPPAEQSSTSRITSTPD